MSKQEKKLVCVGWGIWDIIKKELWSPECGDRERWVRRCDVIERWDYEYGDGSYQWNRKVGNLFVGLAPEGRNTDVQPR